MNIRAKSIKIIFDNSSEDNWEATCGGGIEFDDAMRMIARAWKEYDEPKEPIEPLIKDKKMRQCVKLWTEINEFKGKLMYSEDDDYCSFYEIDSQEELLFLGRNRRKDSRLWQNSMKTIKNALQLWTIFLKN